MTQQPVGTVTLRTAAGEEAAADPSTRISTSAPCACSTRRSRGEGEPAATGEDGVWSLATAVAVRAAAESRRLIAVETELAV